MKKNIQNYNFVKKSIEDILSEVKLNISVESISSIQHYITHSEYAIALEILIMELMNTNSLCFTSKKELLYDLAKEMKLDTHNIYDDDFWNKFKKWCNRY